MSIEIREVLEFMSKYITRKQLMSHFDLSNTESYNLIQSLLKRRLIEEIQMREANKTNRVWYYKTIRKIE